MAIMENEPVSDVMRIWSLLSELSEQLAQNRSLSISLHPLATGVKSQAIHSQTGFVLRRFNLDKPQDVYNAELEKMNAAMSAENRVLQEDNKQLNTLIKEYEQTLENLMASFRQRANEVQQRELNIMRHYEHTILELETAQLNTAVEQSAILSAGLARLGTSLRSTMRVLAGEDPDYVPPTDREEPIINSLEAAPLPYSSPPSELLGSEEESPDVIRKRKEELAAAEWAMERECELARLEAENALLKKLVEEHNKEIPMTGPEGTVGRLLEFPKVKTIPRVGRTRRGLGGLSGNGAINGGLLPSSFSLSGPEGDGSDGSSSTGQLNGSGLVIENGLNRQEADGQVLMSRLGVGASEGEGSEDYDSYPGKQEGW